MTDMSTNPIADRANAAINASWESSPWKSYNEAVQAERKAAAVAAEEAARNARHAADPDLAARVAARRAARNANR